MNFSHLKMILRILVKNHRSTWINILGLAMGFSALVIILSWIRSEYTVDRYHENRGRLHQLVIQFPDGILDSNTPYALAPAMKESFPEVENYSRLVRLETQQSSSFDFFPDDPDNDPVFETHIAEVDTGFFHMFSFQQLHGDVHQGLSLENGIILSHKISQKYFGAENPVGRQILMNGHRLLEIQAVIESPGESQLDYDMFLPAHDILNTSWTWRDPSFIMLKKHCDLKAFEQKIAPFLNASIPNPLPGEFILKVVAMEKTNLIFGKKKEFFLFSAVALLILIIVAFNYMNLTTANYHQRIREMGMRKVNGASVENLRNQLIGETLILTTASMILALFLAELLLPRLDFLFGRSLHIGYLDHALVLPSYLLLIIVFSFSAVAYPVLILTRGNPTAILRDTFVKGQKRSNVLLWTTIIQFAISLSLVISTSVVLKQVYYERNTPPGLQVENVIKLPLNQQLGRQLFSLFNELEAYPGVLGVTAGQANPVNEDYKTNIDWPNRAPEIDPLVRYSICLPTYPSFFGHEIILGRGFRNQDLSDQQHFLINETACGLLGTENPIGHEIEMWGQQGEVIGVFRNFHHISLHREILPQVISIHPAHYRQLKFVFIRLSPDKQQESLTFIHDTFRRFAADFPFSYEFLSVEVDQLYQRDVRMARILGAFTILALLISCLGIYGLAHFSVERKIRDLTIRRVFGASVSSIIGHALKEIMKRFGISILLAIPVSILILERWRRNIAFRTELTLWYFLIGASIGILIPLLTTWIGFRRSLRHKPAEILKQE